MAHYNIYVYSTVYHTSLSEGGGGYKPNVVSRNDAASSHTRSLVFGAILLVRPCKH
jgi:hypothetical protein